MTTYLKNSVFIHIPKTGGIWTSRCLNKCTEVLKETTTPNTHSIPDLGNGRGVFAFVRHPATWLRSLFDHRMAKGRNWNKKSELEKECRSNNFHVFIKNVCSHEGIITKYFERFLHKYREPSGRLFIGKQENLCRDLSEALTKFNEVFDKESVIEMGGIKIHARPHRKQTVLSEDERDRLYESQKDFYRMHDYER